MVERCFNITFMSIGDNSMYSCELEYLNWSVWLYAAHYVVFCNDNLRCDELLGPGTLVLVNWTQTRFNFLFSCFYSRKIYIIIIMYSTFNLVKERLHNAKKDVKKRVQSTIK